MGLPSSRMMHWAGTWRVIAPVLVLGVAIALACWPGEETLTLGPKDVSLQGCTNETGEGWQAVLLVTNTLPFEIEFRACAVPVPDLRDSVDGRASPPVGTLAGEEFHTGSRQLSWHELRVPSNVWPGMFVTTYYTRVKPHATAQLAVHISPTNRNELVIEYSRPSGNIKLLNTIKGWLNDRQTWRTFQLTPPEGHRWTTYQDR